jgi:hypothetical protein
VYTVTALACIVTVPLGIWVSAWSQMLGLVVVMVACLVVERRRTPMRSTAPQ